MEILIQLRDRLIRFIWDTDVSNLPASRARLIGGLRVAYLTLRDLFFDSQLSLRAMSLVYTTLLSLVPLIAVSVSVLKGFGKHEQILPALENFLVPLGERGKEISSTIITFVEGINSGILGSVGLAMLFYTVVSLMQKIESAFNFTWHVGEERSFARRFSDYLSVIMIGPVLVLSAMGITASITSTTLYQTLASYQVFGFLFNVISFLIPYLLIIVAFTLIYIFIPNTKVRIGPALVGATVAGVIWETVGWLFASFISNANYTAIYSAFAALFFFMIWLYLSWSILLTGASIAFYYQNPEFRLRTRRILNLSNRMKEKAAILVMVKAAEAYYQKKTPHSLVALAQYLNLPSESLAPIVNTLTEKGLLIKTDAEPPGLIPGEAPEVLPLIDIISAIRIAEEDDIMNFRRLPHKDRVDAILRSYEDGAIKVIETTTLKDLVVDVEKPTAKRKAV